MALEGVGRSMAIRHAWIFFSDVLGVLRGHPLERYAGVSLFPRTDHVTICRCLPVHDFGDDLNPCMVGWSELMGLFCAPVLL